jgi:hypothetical protein
MKSNHWTILAGLSLLVPALFWMRFAAQGPSALYPFPACMFIPALFGLRQAAAAVPTVLYFVWNPRLFQGDAPVPKRSYVLLTVATLLSVLWFVVGWKDGIAMQGPKYNYSVCAVNVVWIASLWTLLASSRKGVPSFKTNLLFHWMLFAWFAWYAFPFFGEML